MRVSPGDSAIRCSRFALKRTITMMVDYKLSLICGEKPIRQNQTAQIQRFSRKRFEFYFWVPILAFNDMRVVYENKTVLLFLMRPRAMRSLNAESALQILHEFMSSSQRGNERLRQLIAQKAHLGIQYGPWNCKIDRSTQREFYLNKPPINLSDDHPSK